MGWIIVHDRHGIFKTAEVSKVGGDRNWISYLLPKKMYFTG
jgi:hypothetical protein